MPSPRYVVRLVPLAIALTACVAGASTRQPSSGEVAFQGLRSIGVANPATQMALTRGATWQAFETRHGRWSVIWNEATHTPHRAFGRGIPLAGFAENPDAVDGAVRRFVAANPALFGAAPTLERLAADRAGNVWYVRYRQTLGGLPVLFASWEFRVGRNGKLFAFGADAHTPSAGLLAAPRVGTAVARQAAKAGLAFDPATDRVQGGTDLYILPFVSQPHTDYRLVYDVRVHTAKPRGNWLVLVDAGSGAVLWRHNHLLYASSKGQPVRRGAAAPPSVPTPQTFPDQALAVVSGRVTGTVHPLLPSDALQTRNFPGVFVNVGSTQAVTDAAGLYSATCTGSTTVTAMMLGANCHTHRLDAADASFSVNVSCPSTHDIPWNTSNSSTSERDAYYHSNLAHDYVKGIDPAYTASDHDLALNVNSVDDECTAYWSPEDQAIYYGSEGATCPYNMASMPDIVYHEYAQRLNDDFYFWRGSTFGMTNAVLQGGTADAMAAFMTNDPLIGNGIEGSGTYLRSVSNTARWPENRSPDGNEGGLILAGAFWDLKQSVGLSVAERLLHFAKYGLPGEPPPPVLDDGQAMSEYFVETLVADDNDADLSNGTPHFTQINAAFNAHGIGTSNFISINHTVLDDQPTAGPYPVTAVIQYSGPVGALNSSSPTLYYSVNGLPYAAQTMTPTGNPDEWGAEVPPQSGAIVRYYITATDIYGAVKTLPGGAPAVATYLFVAGPASTLIANDMESDAGWVVGAAGDNASSGTWVRAAPVSDGWVQPGEDHTPGGTMCFVTGNAAPTDYPGTNDVDDGHTTLLTPVFSAVGSGITFPIISYYRWYSNNGGDNPNTDFWKVDISNNSGSSWVSVENTSQSDLSWRRVIFAIQDHLTPTSTMKMRFIASDEGQLPDQSLVEAAVDDFTLMGYLGGVVPVPDPATPRVLALAPAAPNPFRSVTRLRYTLPAAGRVGLTVFDVRGRQVRALRSEVEPAGAHTAEWDGRDDAGHPVASGPYFLRLSQAGRKTSEAVVRIQ